MIRKSGLSAGKSDVYYFRYRPGGGEGSAGSGRGQGLAADLGRGCHDESRARGKWQRQAGLVVEGP